MNRDEDSGGHLCPTSLERAPGESSAGGNWDVVSYGYLLASEEEAAEAVVAPASAVGVGSFGRARNGKKKEEIKEREIEEGLREEGSGRLDLDPMVRNGD